MTADFRRPFSNVMGDASFSGQALRQSPHFSTVRHLSGYTPVCLYGIHPSGLPHHAQRSGHPLKKTDVRIPGPSWMVYFCMLKMSALFKTLPFYGILR